MNHRAGLSEELSIDDQSWIGSLASIGALVGTILSWFLTRVLSARKGLIVSSVGIVTGWGLVFIGAQETICISANKTNLNVI